MRGGEQKQGYTIVEVMIFLAISGVMFVVAAGFINGKQAKSEFRQGMNEINSQIQSTISDVSNGFYPSNGNFTCQAANTGEPNLSTTTEEQGANKGCIFMGKVVQFAVPGTNGAGYNTYSVVGRQFKPDSSGSNAQALIPPSSFAEALPRPVTAATTGGVDLTQVQTLKWSMQVEGMFNGDRNHPIDAVGFFSGFAASSGGKLDSGAATPIAVAIPYNPPGNVPAQIGGALRNVSPAVAAANPRIIICFSGGGNQFGRLNIGSDDTSANVDSQKLSTQIQISTGVRTGVCVTP